MGNYTEIKSKFIKEKLKKADWKKDKEDIDNLIFLEKSILRGVSGYGTTLVFLNLKEKYQKDYYKILEELAPRKFKTEMKQREKEIKGYLKLIKDFNEEERKEEKEDWDKAKKKLVGKK